MGLLNLIFGRGRKGHDDDGDKRWFQHRDDTAHHEQENHQRWLNERSKDP